MVRSLKLQFVFECCLNCKSLAPIATEILFLQKKDCSGKRETAPKNILIDTVRRSQIAYKNIYCPKMVQ
ncbi:hypothetical protein AXA65_18000 [Chryseobacterium sp. FP211-J200]|nr:hypothetical protein AXA65_18000 [Chryseobacterium sp. FP211-J200]